VLFYIIAFAGIISQQQSIVAKNHNESVFTLIQNMHYSSNILNILSIFINVCAVFAAFLSIITGMRESIRGVILNILKSFKFPTNNIPRNVFEILIAILIILMTWLSIVFQLSIYKLVPLFGPIFGIIGCLIPCYLVYKVPTLNKYKGFAIYYIIFVGVILCISPLLMKVL
jgi:amino acid permease